MAEKAKARYRIIALVGIIAAIGAIAYGVWSAGQSMHFASLVESTFEGTPVERNIGTTDTVQLRGVWTLEILVGEPKLEIYESENRVTEIDIKQDAAILKLDSARDDGFNLQPVKAKLYLPTLKKIVAEGVTSISLNTVTTENLDVSLTGPVSLDIRDSKIGRLKLSYEGAAKIDASTSKITDAELDLEGAGIAKLSMAGGVLSGSVKGIGKLEYSGTVSSESIDKDGLFVIEQTDTDRD